jgi:hypothetical protein
MADELAIVPDERPEAEKPPVLAKGVERGGWDALSFIGENYINSSSYRKYYYRNYHRNSYSYSRLHSP